MLLPNKTMAKTHAPRLVPNEYGIYEIHFGGKRNRRKSTRTRDLAEAQRELARWIMQQDQQEKASVPTLVSKILDDYLAEHVAENVVDTDRQEDCVEVLRAGLGSRHVHELDSQVMLKYRRAREAGEINGRKVGAGTLRRELNCLVASINHAVRQRRVDASSVPTIALPDAPPPKDTWLTEDELEQFLIAGAGVTDNGRMSRGYRFAVIAAETAARKTSVVTLLWSQVDFGARLIHFQNDGNKRTKKRRVPVPMSDRLYDLLTRAWDERTQDEYVLDSGYSIQHQFGYVCQAAVEATGNDKFADVTPHVLRHTWATQAARAGVPLFEIAGVLGDTLATVMRVYAHHCPDHLRGAVNFRASKPGQQAPQR